MKKLLVLSIFLSIFVLIFSSCLDLGEYDDSSEDSSDTVKIEMIDVQGKVLDVAKSELQEAGFSRITAKPDSIWVDSNWTVIEQNIAPGTLIGKKTSIVLTCVKTEDYIDVTMLSVVGLTEEKATSKLKEAGFNNISVEYSKTITRSRTINDKSRYEVVSQSVKSGTTLKSGDKVTLTCVLKTVTISNNSDFAELMAITDQTDAATIRSYANSHYGTFIEFDGCVALMMKHPNYKTRFDVCLAGVDYTASRVYGPLFAFENVNYYDMYVSGTDTVSAGMDFHITAEIVGFSEEGKYIILKPISLVAR